MLTSPVAVGVTDGQNPDVLRLALSEAARLGRSLRVIHVVESSTGEGASPGAPGHDQHDLLASVPIERVTLFGDAATVLLAESGAACRMVIGSDDPALTSARWSEVAQQIALQATIPVMVVPLTSPARSDAVDVMVAVDEAHLADGPLAYAVEAAEQRGTGVTVVFGAGVTSDYPGRLQHLGRLEDLADSWRVSHPSVAIRVAVEGGHPVESCLSAGSRASLMVLGRPAGKHPRVGSRSVASRILRGSQTPVVIVPLDYVPAEPKNIRPELSYPSGPVR